jgi:hypothetical protein
MNQQEPKQVPVPQIMMYPPLPPINLTAIVPSKITGISPTRVGINPKTKTIHISANIINTHNGIRQNATVHTALLPHRTLATPHSCHTALLPHRTLATPHSCHTALLLNEKDLPKNYCNYTLSLATGSLASGEVV